MTVALLCCHCQHWFLCIRRVFLHRTWPVTFISTLSTGRRTKATWKLRWVLLLLKYVYCVTTSPLITPFFLHWLCQLHHRRCSVCTLNFALSVFARVFSVLPCLANDAPVTGRLFYGLQSCPVLLARWSELDGVVCRPMARWEPHKSSLDLCIERSLPIVCDCSSYRFDSWVQELSTVIGAKIYQNFVIVAINLLLLCVAVMHANDITSLWLGNKSIPSLCTGDVLFRLPFVQMWRESGEKESASVSPAPWWVTHAPWIL